MDVTHVNTDVNAAPAARPAWDATAGEATATTRWLLAIAVTGALVFIALVVIGGAVTDGYDHAAQAISELGATGAEHAGLQATAFVAVGVAICCFAIGLALGRFVPLAVSVLVLAFGVLSGFAQAALPCDAGCEPISGTGTGHIVTGSAGFVAVLVAMFLSWRHWRSRRPELARMTRALATTALVGLVAFNITKAADIEAVDGLAQRVFALSALAWIIATSVSLRREPARAQVTV